MIFCVDEKNSSVYCVHFFLIFSCGCRHGAKLQADGRTCGYDHLLYSASGRYGMIIDPEEEHSEVFVTAPNHIMAISHNPLRPEVIYAYRYAEMLGLAGFTVKNVKLSRNNSKRK